MLIKRAGRFTWSDVTDPRCLLSRRALLAGAAAVALAPGQGRAATPRGAPLGAARNAALSLAEPPTKDSLTEGLNALIAADHPIADSWISEAEHSGQDSAIVLFSSIGIP